MNRKSTDARSDCLAPTRRLRSATRRALLGGLAALPVLLAAVPAMAVIPPGGVATIKPTAAAAAAATRPATVTLITGDRIQLDAQGQVQRIEPGPGRRSIAFTQTKRRGELSVTPSDAAPLIQNGAVDPRLFNVSLLVKYGYDDARRSSVPTIARGFAGGSGSMRAAGMQAPRTLNALRGFSGAVEKRRAGNFWTLVKQGAANTQRNASFGPRLWLDGKRQITLDQSVPQIGGDVAWAAGYTGTGITVAVLDTGIDATHPDFAGRIGVQKNFTTDADTRDMVGHGTHVSSTIAGNGAASGGKYKGVAPDATLAVGKVCTDYGCNDSDILAGMQWAAETVRARVVNMSLGGPGAPGIDPIEEALNTLTATNGTLFVVAAGNAGCGSASTVDSPGTAVAALTVGAIDRAGQMASFSSCGPNQGDGAIKPEVTAPGVSIVAGRSSTGYYAPTDSSGYYTTLSGTSMATPHVAGAAALLAQQHPGWAPADLKGMLVATADRSNTAGLYSQGAGLVNVGTAVGRTWYDAAANLSFGLQSWPHGDDAVLVKQLSLRNSGTQAVSLTLSTQAATPTGSSATTAPPGMFYLSATQVSVPAGGTVSVDLVADTRVNAADGTYTGTVTISDGRADSTTLFSVIKEVESYSLVLNHLDASGQPSTTYQTWVDGLDADTYTLAPASANGKATMRMPKGHYRVTTVYATTPRVDMLVAPSVNLDRDLALTIDGRRTAPWQITVPDPAMQPVLRLFEATSWQLPFGMSSIATYTFDPAQQIGFGRIDAPGAPRTVPNFAFNAEAELMRLTETGETDTRHPIVFVVESSRGVVPTGLSKTYRKSDLASVTTLVPATQGNDVGFVGVRPTVVGGQSALWGFYGANARGRVEFQLNAGPDLLWSNALFWQSFETYEQVALESSPAPVVAGSATTVDWRAPRPYSTSLTGSNLVFDLGGATPDMVQGDPAARLPGGLRRGGTGGQDTLVYAMQPYGDSAGHSGKLSAYSPNAMVVSLARGGTTIFHEDVSSYSSVVLKVPSDTATYTLTQTATTPPAFAGTLGLPVRSTAEWTFQSGSASPSAWTTLPMSTVQLGKLVRSPSGGWQIPLQVLRQAPNLPVADDVQSLTVEVSTDNGSSWKAARLSGAGSQWLAGAPLAAIASQSLSVRTLAVSKDGAQVRQTVIGAYAASAAPAPAP